MKTAFNLTLATLAGVVSLSFAPLASAQDVTGAGASFPAPLYSKWAADYNKATGVKINYQSVGSGAGIKQIDAKTVDFGASDMPLTDEDLKKKGQFQFPTVIGGTVPVVNIKGIAPGQMKLDGQVLGDIYLGKSTKWNDAAIKALNAGLALQIIALGMLLVPPAMLTVLWVMAAQALSGIAKDLNKMSAKSSLKLLVPGHAQDRLYKWVALLTCPGTRRTGCINGWRC